DRALEALANRRLRVGTIEAVLIGKGIQCILAAEGEDEVLSRHAEIARHAVERRERDLLERLGEPSGIAPLTRLARVRDRRRLGRGATEREVRDDDYGDEAEGDEERERTLHARLRHERRASGTSAQSVSALARKNGCENAFVTARSS